ncbi:hypothetical protein [Lyngbya aestuarii]|uniref:hypothetical protein n=1 Tax=Lyngbya aestuarii TaxID=118322 RepID=UPI00403E2849
MNWGWLIRWVFRVSDRFTHFAIALHSFSSLIGDVPRTGPSAGVAVNEAGRSPG